MFQTASCVRTYATKAARRRAVTLMRKRGLNYFWFYEHYGYIPGVPRELGQHPGLRYGLMYGRVIPEHLLR